jgi:hypothetical protein
MNIIIENNTNLVIWSGTNLPKIINDNFNVNNSYIGISSKSNSLIKNIQLPEHYVNNTYTYIDGNWEIVNQQNYDNYVSDYNKKQKQKRAEAYKNESDQLFFKAQREEIPMQEWLDKVNEIKTKFSYIE